MIPLRSLFCIIIIFNLVSCSEYLEAEFELSENSRLPKWIAVPDGMNRQDFSVEMISYIAPNGSKDIFKIYQKYQKNRVVCIKKFIVAENDKTKNSLIRLRAGVPPEIYPVYIIVTINGITDIMVHRKMEPFFYMEDDHKIWEKVKCLRKDLGLKGGDDVAERP